jgi:hypothetical protein
MTRAQTIAVLGFRPHTYWTAVVAVAGEADAPQVIERRRIVFASGDERSVFHQAAEAPPAQAASLIAKARAATQANAGREIATLIADLKGAGVLVRVAATAAASTKVPEKLEDILGSHARIHAAEGNFYRDVVAQGCSAVGLDVRRLVERELPALTSDLLGIKAPMLNARLKEMGAALGPPWGEDYKLATQAAWLCLDDAGQI